MHGERVDGNDVEAVFEATTPAARAGPSRPPAVAARDAHLPLPRPLGGRRRQGLPHARGDRLLEGARPDRPVRGPRDRGRHARRRRRHRGPRARSRTQVTEAIKTAAAAPAPRRRPGCTSTSTATTTPPSSSPDGHGRAVRRAEGDARNGGRDLPRGAPARARRGARARRERVPDGRGDRRASRARTRSPPACCKKCGPQAVRETPIAEEGFVGAGIGAAMLGLRPVVEIMTINFILVAMDMVVNHAAKISPDVRRQGRRADGASAPRPARARSSRRSTPRASR